MLSVRTYITRIKTLRGITWDEWGEKCNRTGAAIKKLTEEDANPTVSTLNGILPAVGASLEILTDEDRVKLESYDIMIEKMKALEQLRDIQTSRIETLDEEIRKRDERTSELLQTISKQQDTIYAYIHRMESREQAIDRKDARIVELEKRLGIW